MQMYFTQLLSQVCHNVSKQRLHPEQNILQSIGKNAKRLQGKINTKESKIEKTSPLCLFKRIFVNDLILLMFSPFLMSDFICCRCIHACVHLFVRVRVCLCVIVCVYNIIPYYNCKLVCQQLANGERPGQFGHSPSYTVPSYDRSWTSVSIKSAFILLEIFSLLWRRHHYCRRAKNVDLCSTLMAIGQ